MKPGRELDQLIAKKVFGLDLPISIVYFPGETPASVELCPFYSTDIASAWLVLETINPVSIERTMLVSGKIQWTVLFCNPRLPEPKSYYDGRVTAESAPHAICLAALRALGVEILCYDCMIGGGGDLNPCETHAIARKALDGK